MVGSLNSYKMELTQSDHPPCLEDALSHYAMVGVLPKSADQKNAAKTKGQGSSEINLN
jgi:hypothetical protein